MPTIRLCPRCAAPWPEPANRCSACGASLANERLDRPSRVNVLTRDWLHQAFGPRERPILAVGIALGWFFHWWPSSGPLGWLLAGTPGALAAVLVVVTRANHLVAMPLFLAACGAFELACGLPVAGPGLPGLPIIGGGALVAMQAQMQRELSA